MYVYIYIYIYADLLGDRNMRQTALEHAAN